MKTAQVRSFSMIELMIALIIVVMTIIGTISLLPVGFESNRDSVGRINAGDAGEQFIEMVASQLYSDSRILESLPDAMPTGDDAGLTWSKASMMDPSNIEILFATSDELAEFDPAVHKSGMFRVRHLTDSWIIDFDGVFRVWKTVHSTNVYDASIESAKINVEVSWPNEIPYDKRQKATYQMDVFIPSSGSHILKSFPTCTAWHVDNDSHTLNYMVLSGSSPVNQSEGAFTGDGAGLSFDDMAISSDGVIHLISNNNLYRVFPKAVDKDSATGVLTDLLGASGISSDTLASLHFVGPRLYAMGHTSKKIYELDTGNGKATEVGQLTVNGGFQIEAAAVGSDGYLYLVKGANNNSELWRFDQFPQGNIQKVMTISGSKRVTSLTAHPAGVLYAADEFNWFCIKPRTQTMTTEVSYSSNIGGLSIYYQAESADSPCTPEPAFAMQGLINVNPNNSFDNYFFMTLQNGDTFTRSDLHSYFTGFNGTTQIIRIKPGGGGQQNTMTVNGQPYDIRNNVTYMFSGEAIATKLYNTHHDENNGLAMGQWVLELSGTNVTIETED